MLAPGVAVDSVTETDSANDPPSGVMTGVATVVLPLPGFVVCSAVVVVPEEVVEDWVAG